MTKKIILATLAITFLVFAGFILLIFVQVGDNETPGTLDLGNREDTSENGFLNLLPRIVTQGPSVPVVSKNQSEAPTTSRGYVLEHFINYTDQGFDPSQIDIEVGDTITFLHQGLIDEDMRVISDPHPTHDDLFGFDSVRGYRAGEPFSFVFSDSGLWGYHNEFRPQDKGTIIVK